jgi:hypothetical protein
MAHATRERLRVEVSLSCIIFAISMHFTRVLYVLNTCFAGTATERCRDSAMAASQNGVCSCKLSIHKETNIMHADYYKPYYYL